MLRILKFQSVTTTTTTCSSLFRSPTAIVSKKFSSSSIVPFKLADIGEGITEVEVLQWFVKESQPIKQFDKVCEVQSDKATVEITSRFAGTVSKLYYKKGDIAKVGSPLIDIEVSGSTSSKSVPAPATPTPAATTPVSSSSIQSDLVSESFEKVLTTPAVRRIARENNIDLTKVSGTGKNSRVMKEDVLNFLKTPSTTSASTPTPPTPISSTPISSSDRIEPIRGLRRAMVKSMTAATQVPHFGYADEIFMDNLVLLRTTLKSLASSRGIKLSFMPFFIKAASLALNKYPILNSSISSDLQNIIYHSSHNIGVAMDTPQGLLVPNIKNVQNLSIFEIAAELNRLQQLGKDAKLSASDLSGGTFTLSNIGTIGGTYASPVLMLPEVAIAAIGKMRKLPRFDERDQVKAVQMVNVSWSADHRVIDGATMANFSNVWKQYLENPSAMMLDMK